MHKLHVGLVQPLVYLFTPNLTLPHIPLHLIHHQGPRSLPVGIRAVARSRAVWRNQVKGWGHGYYVLQKRYIRIIPVDTTRH